MSEAAVRVWLEEPDLCVSWERFGIPFVTLRLRREAAVAVVAKTNELFAAAAATGGDPEIIETLSEVATMVKEVLAGSTGQVLPLTGGDGSRLDMLFGAPS